MAHDYPFAGLTVGGKKHQAERFVKMFRDITTQKQVITSIGDFAKVTRLLTYKGIEKLYVLDFNSC